MRVETVYLDYQQWEKIIDLYANTNYLLKYNNPVEQIKKIFDKIPNDFNLKNEGLQKIANNLASCKNTVEEMGFNHNLKELSEKILALKKHLQS